MKAKTIIKRIDANFLTQKGALKARYAGAVDFVLSGRTVLHGKRWSSRGQSLSTNANDRLWELLDLLGVDYVTGNDAPRGGVEGDYIKLTDKGQKQVAELVKLYKEYKSIIKGWREDNYDCFRKWVTSRFGY